MNRLQIASICRTQSDIKTRIPTLQKLHQLRTVLVGWWEKRFHLLHPHPHTGKCIYTLRINRKKRSAEKLTHH